MGGDPRVDMRNNWKVRIIEKFCILSTIARQVYHINVQLELYNMYIIRNIILTNLQKKNSPALQYE